MDNITQYCMDKYNPPTYIKDSCGVLILENKPNVKEKNYLNSAIPKIKLFESYIIAVKISNNKYYLCKNFFGKSEEAVSKKEMLSLIVKAREKYINLLEYRINSTKYCLEDYRQYFKKIEQEFCDKIKTQEEELKLVTQTINNVL